MEKVIEALKTFNYIMTRCEDEDSYIIKFPLGIQKGTTFGEDMEKAYKVMKQALLELIAIKEANPSEALEKLDKINNYLNDVYDYKEIKEEIQKDINAIKQALLKAQEQEKVLEIINKKSVYIHLLQQCGDVESYNNYFITKYGLDEFTERLLLTQEEFDTLKRWKNE